MVYTHANEVFFFFLFSVQRLSRAVASPEHFLRPLSSSGAIPLCLSCPPIVNSSTHAITLVMSVMYILTPVYSKGEIRVAENSYGSTERNESLNMIK